MTSPYSHGVAVQEKTVRAEGANPPLFLVIAICLCSPHVYSFAFDKPKAYRPHPAPKIAPNVEDAYDLLYMRKPGPVWLRLHVRSGGQPVATRWDHYLETLFRDLDVNGDGFLDAKECERLPAPQMLQNATQNGYVYPWVAGPAAFAQIDTNRDGRADRAELAAFYSRYRVGHFRIQPLFDPDPYAERISRAIFQFLDTNKDGKLSRSELAGADKLIDKYDLDEDECLTVQELLPTATSGVYQSGNRAPPDIKRFLVSRPAEPVNGLAQRLLAVYDEDKDYHLSHEEIGLTKAAFDRLDLDRNGKLDIPELADFFSNGLPDVEAWFEIDAAKNLVAMTRCSIRPETVGIQRFGKLVRIQLELSESIDLGDSPIASGNQMASRNNARENLMQTFNLIAGPKGYFDAKDLENPNYRGYQSFVTLGDRNRDGRLTRDEMNALLDLHLQATEGSLTISILRQNTNWFSALDTNHDGRLSRQELRNGWKPLAALQESPGEFIAPPDRQQRLRLTVHPPGNVYVGNASLTYLNPAVPRAASAGPLWFRKMDRNGDGVVSRREFLGPKEQFDRIDRNGDGLIDLDEAERATPGK